jgi:hypothetical protein
MNTLIVGWALTGKAAFVEGTRIDRAVRAA